MSDYSLKVKIDGDASGLEEAAKKSESALGKLKESATKGLDAISQTTGKLGKSMTIGVTTPIMAAGAASVKAGLDFEEAMAKLSTIADTTEATGVPIEELTKQITELSNETGIASAEIANNVYDAISAGQSTGDAVAFVANATKLAKAGFTSSASALDILTTTLNAYGLESKEVGRISDILINTQNLGKTTVDQLAASMGKVIPTAKAQGVSIENLAAMYSVMTANGIATAESTTYMNSMLNELGKQGSKAYDAFKEGTQHIKEGGLDMKEAMESGWELTDVLSVLDEQALASGTNIANMFGSAEAGKAATVLWDNATKVNEVVGSMNTTLGATDEAFSKLETTTYKGQIALNQLKNSSIELGGAILEQALPYFEKLVNMIERGTNWFSNLDQSQKDNIVRFGAFAAAAGPVLSIVSKIAGGISGAISVFGGLTSAIGAVAGVGGFGALAAAAAPFLIGGAIVAGVIAGIVLIVKNFDKIKNAISGVIDWIKGLWDNISGFFSSIGSFIENSPIGKIADKIFDTGQTTPGNTTMSGLRVDTRSQPTTNNFNIYTRQGQSNQAIAREVERRLTRQELRQQATQMAY